MPVIKSPVFIAVGCAAFIAFRPFRRIIQILSHPNLLADFNGFIDFAVSRVGEGAFLLCIEGGA